MTRRRYTTSIRAIPAPTWRCCPYLSVEQATDVAASTASRVVAPSDDTRTSPGGIVAALSADAKSQAAVAAKCAGTSARSGALSRRRFAACGRRATVELGLAVMATAGLSPRACAMVAPIDRAQLARHARVGRRRSPLRSAALRGALGV
jgi:hypothetical protein